MGLAITCHDGTRLRLSELRDPAPQKGDVVETLDTGQISQDRPLARRKGGRFTAAPFSGHTDRNLRLIEVPLSASTALDATKQRNTD